jgi:7-carboxy-7-deazaguanine synthase
VIQSLPIAETFLSIQGEGRLAGTRSWFARVSGCNLRCAWCDTPYASWQPEGAARSIEALLAEAAASGATHAVITGGEPLVFPHVADLARGLRAAGMHVTIETAGSVHLAVECDLMSVSPKLANSTPGPDLAGEWSARHEARRLNPGALQLLIDEHPRRQLKFVVMRDADIPEIEALLARLRNLEPADVYLMPEGVTAEALRAKAGWLSAAAAARDWRVSPRMHIELFGNTRGV